MKYPVLAALLLSHALAATRFQVTAYDTAQLPSEVRQAVFDSLRTVLRHSGIELEVSEGNPSSPESTLIQYPEPPKRGKKGLRCEAGHRSRDLGCDALNPQATILGMATPLATEGLNARVFADRVKDAAFREGRDFAAVLAHAIAHEIGHVLMRSGEHCRSGLMAASWSSDEYAWMARGIIWFTREQAKAMRDTLSGVGCSGIESASVARNRGSVLSKGC